MVTSQKNLKSQIMSKLEKVLDPELNISIVDLGLVYKILVGTKVKIVMTLTAIGCPLFSVIEREVINRVAELGYKEKNIKVELTFDPPWSMDRMSEKGKAMLGI